MLTLLLPHRNCYLENTVIELRLGLIDLGAFRELNTAIETSITPLRAMDAALFFFVFKLAFALDDKGIAVYFDLHFFGF